MSEPDPSRERVERLAGTPDNELRNPPAGLRSRLGRRRLKWCFAIGMAVGVIGGYVVLKSLDIKLTLHRNVERDAGLAASAKRAWAQPIQRPGLPNLHKVSDQLYRGARPEAEGYAQLKAMGIRTVVNLESFHQESDKAEPAGLAYEHIYMKAWHGEREDVIRLLRIATDPARTPVFVHCQHGSDRTGTMCAIYRIVVEGWSKGGALEEMQCGGFGFHEMWGNLDRFIRELDVESIREELNLPASAPSQPD